MTSRLSSLLVSGGVVAVRRMEKAFQRQVLFGGGLDTILLEMNELPEQRLVQFLSMATGLPPATARELDGADPRAAARCSRDLAERFSVVPLWFEGEALRVVTRDPVDLGALEVLANELEVAIQPFVAPEFRYELAFDKVYGRASDERFTRLAEASRLSAIPPAGRTPSVVVESAATKSGSIPLPSQARAGAALGSAPAAAPSAGGSQQQPSSAPIPDDGAPGAAHGASGAAHGESGADGAPGAAHAARGTDAASGTASGASGAASGASGAAHGARGTDAASGTASGASGAAHGASGAAHGARGTDAASAHGASVAAHAREDGPGVVASAGRGAASASEAGGARASGGAADDAGAAEQGAAEGSGPVGRRTLEMTPEAVRQRREEVERQAADAYRRHTGPESVVAPLEEMPGLFSTGAPGSFDVEPDTAPSTSAPTDAELAGIDAEAAPVVVLEYETSEATSLAVTAPFARAIDDRPPGIVSGEIGAGESSAPPVMEASAAPTAPLAAGDSAPTVHPFRQAAFDPSPLELGEARELLIQAEHRDRVFEVLLRAVRARTGYVALLTVQGGAAIGRVAIAGDEVDNTSITQVLIPLDAPSSFRQTVSSTSPYIGPVQTGDAEIDGMIRRMGGVLPPSALLMPLVLRNRVVALLIGHRGGDMLRVTEVSELLPLAAAASDALGRIIRRSKKSRQMPAVLAPAAAALAGGVPEGPQAIDESAPTTRMAIVTASDAELDTGTATDPRAARPAAAGDPSLSPLSRQLLDPDARVRDAAVERLSSGPRAQLDEALADARTALASDDPAEVAAAAAALAALADVRSIPALLDLHARGGEQARVAARALVYLTKQDLGDSTRKWRQWWDKNRRKNRMEWLVEGLSHKDTEIRRSAVDELRRVTGEFFGYHHDLPRREREQARQRWIVWWQETGRLRFLPDGEPDRAQAGSSPAARPREY